MKNTVTLYLNKISDIQEFANIITSFAEKAFITRNGKTFDAKSILGVILLGGKEPVEVTLDSDDETVLERFNSQLQPFFYKEK